MKEELIIAGAGGQGIMLLGKVLAEAAMLEDKHVTWLPSYGAEVRGGTAHCMVIISDTEIGSPYVIKADTLIIMNEPSLVKFKDRVKKSGLLVVNNSLAQTSNVKSAHLAAHPFTDLAVGLGNIRVANMIALGCFVSMKHTVKLQTLSAVIKKFAPAGKEGLVKINEEALQKGASLR